MLFFSKQYLVRLPWRICSQLLLLIALSSSAVESYLDNGVVKVGSDLALGGSITYLSASGTSNNMVNSYDLGRQIQQSYYSGPEPYDPSNNVSPYWVGWAWNPIQSGDYFTNHSILLDSTNDGQTIYVKCRPMQWALDNVPGECTFETWIQLDGNVVTVSNRLLNARPDTNQYRAYEQELPAVYTIGKYYRLYSYSGDAPFTGAPVTNFPAFTDGVQFYGWDATECWAAFLNTTNWGLGVYSPGIIRYSGGFVGTPNTGGPKDPTTGYLSPVHDEILDSNIEYTFSYNLIVGTLQQIRDWVYTQPYRSGCNFNFQSDRQHWWYSNTTDSGWPIVDRLHVNLGGFDPQMISPVMSYAATNVPKLYIKAAYNMSHPTGQNTGRLYWKTNATDGFLIARSVQFTALTDEQYHIYELDLLDSSTYTGTIRQFRFDPVTAGDPGDYMDLAWISSSPFAYNDAVKPILGIRQDGGKVVVSFLAKSGTAAGYVGNQLLYHLEQSTNFPPTDWQAVPGYVDFVGNGSEVTYTNSPSNVDRHFRVRVTLQ